MGGKPSFAASATLIGSRFGCGRSAGSSTGRPNCIAAVRIGAIIPFYIRALLARPKLSKYVFDFPIDGIAIGHRPTQSSISGRFLHVQIRAVGDQIFKQRAITTLL